MKGIFKGVYRNKGAFTDQKTGEREPPLDIIINLAKYYKVSIDYIAGLTNNKGGIGNQGAGTIEQQNNIFGGNNINIKNKR